MITNVLAVLTIVFFVFIHYLLILTGIVRIQRYTLKKSIQRIEKNVLLTSSVKSNIKIKLTIQVRWNTLPGVLIK